MICLHFCHNNSIEYIFAGNNIAPYFSTLFAGIKISHELRIFDANIYIICKVSTALNMTKIVQILFFRPYINIVENLYFHPSILVLHSDRANRYFASELLNLNMNVNIYNDVINCQLTMKKDKDSKYETLF